MHIVEYRISLPFSVEEYKRAQLYMIARHCHQESEKGEGVEVVKYEACQDPVYGLGHYTEKRVHLYSKLPVWAQSFVPNMFYIEEKSRNFFPYTETEYACSFLPKFSISVQTRYENNTGEDENCLELTKEELNQRIVDHIDIVNDQIAEYRYKETEDPTKITVNKTNPPRGPLKETWKSDFKNENLPIMCAYKIVKAKFEVWGFQTKVEAWAQKTIRDILLLAHRQAFCWTDEWYDMSYEEIVKFEQDTYKETNTKVLASNGTTTPNDLTNKKSNPLQPECANKIICEFD